MAFKKKTWVDRMVEYAGRRKITNVTTMAAQIVDVERAEGVVSEEGTAINAVNMNDLEQRTADAFSAVQQDIEGINSDLGGVKVIPEGSGANVKYYAQLGADAASKKLLGDMPSKLNYISAGISGSNNVSVPAGDYYFMVSVWATGGAGNCSIISFPGVFTLLGSAAIEENGNSKVFLYKIENATASSVSVYVNAPGSSHGVRFYSLTR